jgi:hypothetical protein
MEWIEAAGRSGAAAIHVGDEHPVHIAASIQPRICARPARAAELNGPAARVDAVVSNELPKSQDRIDSFRIADAFVFEERRRMHVDASDAFSEIDCALF